MKKNNTKVELKKYLSQKEKIKNTFISSCIILVILTFFIFITYSYFINKTGEIEVGNFNSSISDVKIIKSENVENTNYQQMEFTIHNYSNTNTYSYNLNWKDKASGHFGQIYYKIPSEEYSHPVGIIKPNETKKIRLVTTYSISKPLSVDPNNGPWHIKLDSGYEYSKPKLEEGYENIKYSPLSETTELTDLTSSYGTLKPTFNKNVENYDLYVQNTSARNITLIGNLTNNGKIIDAVFDMPEFNSKIEVNRKLKVYAEDGTYIRDYTIKNIIKDNSDIPPDLNKIFKNGIITSVRFEYPDRNDDKVYVNKILFVNGKHGGYENNSTITIYVPYSKVKGVKSFKNFIIAWSYLDGEYFLHENNKDWYYFCTVDSPPMYGIILNEGPKFTIDIDFSYEELEDIEYDINVHFNRYGQLTNYAKKYHIKFKYTY